MSKTRIVVLGLAIASAGLAAYLAQGYLKRSDSEVAQINKVQTEEVLIAARDIAMGDRMELAAMTWTSWPKDHIASTMITKKGMPDAPTKFKDGRARNPIYQGEPISEKKVVIPGEKGFMAAILPSGHRAISVKISAETGAGGFILPNDRVDIILTRKVSGGKGSDRQTSETVLTNVRVLAIDQTYKQDEKGGQVVVGKTATVELDPVQAEVLSMVESSGQLSLALRSIADSGDSTLGDDQPMLSEKFSRGSSGGEVSLSRWGVTSYTSSSK
jgi:pilus assembly protein CpaB